MLDAYPAFWIETKCGQDICFTYFKPERPGAIHLGLTRDQAMKLTQIAARALRDN